MVSRPSAQLFLELWRPDKAGQVPPSHPLHQSCLLKPRPIRMQLPSLGSRDLPVVSPPPSCLSCRSWTRQGRRRQASLPDSKGGAPACTKPPKPRLPWDLRVVSHPTRPASPCSAAPDRRAPITFFPGGRTRKLGCRCRNRSSSDEPGSASPCPRGASAMLPRRTGSRGGATRKLSPADPSSHPGNMAAWRRLLSDGGFQGALRRLRVREAEAPRP